MNINYSPEVSINLEFELINAISYLFMVKVFYNWLKQWYRSLKQLGVLETPHVSRSHPPDLPSTNGNHPGNHFTI